MRLEGALIDRRGRFKYDTVLLGCRTHAVASDAGRLSEPLEVTPVEVKHGMARLSAIVAMRGQYAPDFRVAKGVGGGCHYLATREAQKKGALAARPSVSADGARRAGGV